MKKIISLLLCACMLLTALTGCGFGFGRNDGELFTGVSHPYGDSVNSDGDANGRGENAGSSNNGSGADFGGDGDGFVSESSGSGFSGNSSGNNAGVTIKMDIPTTGDVLAIAKKYYTYHSAALNGDLKGEFTSNAGAVSFDGKSNDAERSESLCTYASSIAMFEGDGDYSVACAAAAIGWSQGYARASGTLASILELAGFVADKDRLNDAAKLAAYAISIDNGNADFYITLGWVRFDLYDLDGALEAAEAALTLEPGNSAALKLKIEILYWKGGTFLSASAKQIGDELEENDGELSKRISEQEKAAKNIPPHEMDRSKAEYLSNLQQLYALEVITPADMTDTYFPGQSSELREKILTISEEDKKLRIPEFPADLVSSGVVAAHNDCAGLLSEYILWLIDQRDIANDKYWDIKNNTPKDGRYIDYHDLSPVDCMILYNEQVYQEALSNFGSYVMWIWGEDIDPVLQSLSEAGDPRLKELKSIYESTRKEEDWIKFRLASNEYIEKTIEATVPLYIEWYNTVVDEAQRLWENMLPFARCSRYPEVSVAELYAEIMEWVIQPGTDIDLLWYHTNTGQNYEPNLSYADLESAAAALAKYMSAETGNNANSLQGYSVSVDFGPFKFKLSTNKVEAEYVNGAACRVAYDWKAKDMEFGVGAGYKAKIGAVQGAQVGVEAKGFVNFVVNLKSNEVTDVYISAEAKGSAGSYTSGGQGRVSLMGKGASISSSAKQKLGPIAIEHKTALIKSG